MPIYSHSRLQTFEQCKLRFKYQYIDKIPREEQSIEAFLGNRFHEVMEKLYKDIDIRLPKLIDLQKLFDELWEKNWGEHVFITKSERASEDYKKIGHIELENYYVCHHPFKRGKVLGLERRFLLDLDGSGKYLLQCYLDRVMEREHGIVEIHDYKTGSSYLPEQSALDRDKQLALYEMAVRQAWPDIKEVDLIWHYVFFGRVMQSKRTPEELDKLRKRTMSIIDEVESAKDYPPCESALCSWCNFQDLCPLFSHMYKTSAMSRENFLKEDGVVLVNELARIVGKKSELKAEVGELEKIEEMIKEAIAKFADKEGIGTVYGVENKAKVSEDIKISYPSSKDDKRKAFEDCLEKLGMFSKVSSINWSKLKSIAKKENWVVKKPEELDQFVDVSPTKVVRLARRKESDDV